MGYIYKNNIIKIEFYTITYFIFLILFYLIVSDIYSNYRFFEKTKNLEGIALLEKTHFLCANPTCSRCGGWYWGLALSLAITLTLKDSIIPVVRNNGISTYYFIIAGIIIFLITTPFHGTLNFLTKKESIANKNNKIKLALGIISGFSLSLIVMGILMLMD